MLGTNIFSSLFTGVSLLMEGLLFSNLFLCLNTPALAYDVISMSIFSMTGMLMTQKQGPTGIENCGRDREGNFLAETGAGPEVKL